MKLAEGTVVVIRKNHPAGANVRIGERGIIVGHGHAHHEYAVKMPDGCQWTLLNGKDFEAVGGALPFNALHVGDVVIANEDGAGEADVKAGQIGYILKCHKNNVYKVQMDDCSVWDFRYPEDITLLKTAAVADEELLTNDLDAVLRKHGFDETSIEVLTNKDNALAISITAFRRKAA